MTARCPIYLTALCPCAGALQGRGHLDDGAAQGRPCPRREHSHVHGRRRRAGRGVDRRQQRAGPWQRAERAERAKIEQRESKERAKRERERERSAERAEIKDSGKSGERRDSGSGERREWMAEKSTTEQREQSAE